MISTDQLNSLKVGDVFEAGSIIPGLSEEKLVWYCIHLMGEGTELIVSFEVTYFGVWFARYKGFINKRSKVSFREVGS